MPRLSWWQNDAHVCECQASNAWHAFIERCTMIVAHECGSVQGCDCTTRCRRCLQTERWQTFRLARPYMNWMFEQRSTDVKRAVHKIAVLTDTCDLGKTCIKQWSTGCRCTSTAIRASANARLRFRGGRFESMPMCDGRRCNDRCSWHVQLQTNSRM